MMKVTAGGLDPKGELGLSVAPFIAETFCQYKKSKGLPWVPTTASIASMDQ